MVQKRIIYKKPNWGIGKIEKQNFSENLWTRLLKNTRGKRSMDSIDYFDKRKDPKKEKNDFLNEWNALKKNKKTLENKSKESKFSAQKNDEKINE